MDIEVIHNRIEALVLWRHPLLHVAQEIHPGGDRAAAIIFGQRLTRRRTKRAKDISLTTAALVNLLYGALRRTRGGLFRLRAYQVLPRITLRRHRPHLIETDHRTLCRRRGIERVNAPLFWANSGSTRSPNHVSCVRQRRPSAINRSSIRLRLIGILFSALR